MDSHLNHYHTHILNHKSRAPTPNHETSGLQNYLFKLALISLPYCTHSVELSSSLGGPPYEEEGAWIRQDVFWISALLGENNQESSLTLLTLGFLIYKKGLIQTAFLNCSNAQSSLKQSELRYQTHFLKPALRAQECNACFILPLKRSACSYILSKQHSNRIWAFIVLSKKSLIQFCSTVGTKSQALVSIMEIHSQMERDNLLKPTWAPERNGPEHHLTMFTMKNRN